MLAPRVVLTIEEISGGTVQSIPVLDAPRFFTTTGYHGGECVLRLKKLEKIGTTRSVTSQASSLLNCRPRRKVGKVGRGAWRNAAQGT